MANFECTKCGKCCKFPAKGDVHVDKVGPFHYLHGGKFNGQLFYGWEAKRMNKFTDKAFLPQAFLMDRNNKRLIVMQWVLATDGDCPLLDENQCTAYDARPITCKSFPVIESGLEAIQLKKKFLPKSSSSCPAANVKDIHRPQRMSQAVTDYWKYWGSSYLYSVANMRADLALKKIAAILENDPSIEYGEGLEDKDIIALAESGKSIDIMEAYSETFKIPAEEVNAFVDDLDSEDAAREGVERTSDAIRTGIVGEDTGMGS